MVPVLLLVTAILLAGCHDLSGTTREHRSGGTTDEAPEPENTTQDPPSTDNQTEDPAPPQRLELALALEADNLQTPAFPGETINFTLTIEGNTTQAEWIGIRWSHSSTQDNDDEKLRPSAFTGSHATQESNLSVPGEFPIDGWAPQSLDTHYVRAHLEADGFHYWSNEIQIDLTPIVEQVDETANETIRMRTNILNPCNGDNYSIENLEIAAGESVSWRNAAACDHTATHDADKPLWSTGQLEPNDSSATYRFNKPGTYEYHCTNHPEMSAQIVVV